MDFSLWVRDENQSLLWRNTRHAITQKSHTKLWEFFAAKEVLFMVNTFINQKF